MPLDLLTLNHRVPGSSPGAPTMPFKHLTVLIGLPPRTVYTTVYSFVLASSFSTAALAS